MRDLLIAEYEYWEKVEDAKVLPFAMGAMGALSNVLAAVTLNTSVEEYRHQITQRDLPLVQRTKYNA